MIKFKTVLISVLLISLTACSIHKTLSEKELSIAELRKQLDLTSYNEDYVISLADLSDENINSWVPESGIRGRYEIFKKYLSKSILENIVGEEAFLSGPHSKELNFKSDSEFGHYNPKFLVKLGHKLNALFAEETFIRSAQSIYDSQLKKYLQVYYLSYEVAVNNEEVKNGYLNRISGTNTDGGNPEPSFYLQESFRDFSSSIYNNDGYDVYEGFTCPGFWVRRSIDGTSDEFYDLLLLAMKAFDPEFIKE